MAKESSKGKVVQFRRGLKHVHERHLFLILAVRIKKRLQN